MKIKIKNYSFDKTAQTVTFLDYGGIKLDGVLLITNVTRNIIIYNFAKPTLGGSVVDNVLTLLKDTSSMDDTDKLQIFYEDDEMSIYDKIVAYFTIVSDWWDIILGWRATAVNINDNELRPALLQINNGTVGTYVNGGYIDTTTYQGTTPWLMGTYRSNMYNYTTALLANATLSGSTISVTQFSHIYFSIFTLQNSADNGLILEQSQDASTWYPINIPEKILAMAVGQNKEMCVPVNMNYFRFSYTNGAIATGTPFAVRVFGTNTNNTNFSSDRNGNLQTRQPNIPTYSACTALFTPTGNTDLWDFYGVANRKIQIQQIIISGFATTGTYSNNWTIKKKSTANTGGTSTSPTKIPVDSSMVASTATIKSYTVSPTLGTVIGDIFRKAVYIPPTAGVTNDTILELDFTGNTGMSPITLNSASEGISLNLGAVTIVGLQLQVTVLYTESFYL